MSDQGLMYLNAMYFTNFIFVVSLQVQQCSASRVMNSEAYLLFYIKSKPAIMPQHTNVSPLEKDLSYVDNERSNIQWYTSYLLISIAYL